MAANESKRFADRIKTRKPVKVPQTSQATIVNDENDFPFAANTVSTMFVGSAHVVVDGSQEATVLRLMEKLVQAMKCHEAEPKVRILYK